LVLLVSQQVLSGVPGVAEVGWRIDVVFAFDGCNFAGSCLLGLVGGFDSAKACSCPWLLWLAALVDVYGIVGYRTLPLRGVETDVHW
jgi:uncharacterized Fe-S cluster protein YjdI